MLHSGSDKGGHTGSFKTAVIDTLVAEVQNVPGDGECSAFTSFPSAELICNNLFLCLFEDRCVLLLGYKDQMEEMFQVKEIEFLLRFR
jgi:hypothetical protein